MAKNSEWGAIAYLTHSKYGRNGKEVVINNVSVEGEYTTYAVTGYSGEDETSGIDVSRNVATLTQNAQSGSWTVTQKQSSTGNIYGIYDLSGGLWEWTAGYIETTGNFETYAGSLKGESTKYKTKYAGNASSEEQNYLASLNITRVGEAIWETSVAGAGDTSWNKDYSYFMNVNYPFSLRGASYSYGTSSGIFAFSRYGGSCYNIVGFRSVLVVE